MFNTTTQGLIDIVTRHLVSLGHTNIKSCPRWEHDGVFHVWSDQSTIGQDPDGVRYGWTLDVSGTDCPHFSPGISFSWSPKSPRDEEYVVVTSLTHLSHLIKTHSS
jgi:hypothetical protein